MNARDIVPRRGRPTVEALTIEFVRPLTAADLVELSSTPAQKLGPPPLKKLGAIHQKAAQLVAAGHNDTEVALAVGRTPQRIRDLKVDPAFANSSPSTQASAKNGSPTPSSASTSASSTSQS
jgi:hypothetical protein